MLPTLLTVNTQVVQQRSVSFEVASTNNIAVNDVLSIAPPTPPATPSAPAIATCTVMAIAGTTITCDATIGVNVLVGSEVVETSADSTIRLIVTEVDADNVENGQDVLVVEDSVALGEDNAETQTPGDGDCKDTDQNDSGLQGVGTADNFLCGIQFDLVPSGMLTATDGATIVNDTNILVANATEVEVFRVRFSAADDEVQIRDLYFVNDTAAGGSAGFGDRVDFKLYNEDGQLVQEEQMTDTQLHFELANQDRIRVPKDSSTTISIRVDVRDITRANQTGETLALTIDNTQGTDLTGIEAVTAATGSDLTGDDITESVFW